MKEKCKTCVKGDHVKCYGCGCWCSQYVEPSQEREGVMLYRFHVDLSYSREFEIEAYNFEEAIAQLNSDVATMNLGVLPGDSSIDHIELIEEIFT